jgi:hypothetical protein
MGFSNILSHKFAVCPEQNPNSFPRKSGRYILKTFTLRRGGKKKGFGGREFPPHSRFFAAAIFGTLYEMRHRL